MWLPSVKPRRSVAQKKGASAAQRVRARLSGRIEAAARKDRRTRELEANLRRIAGGKAAAPGRQRITASEIWRSDARMNRTVSYYDCEEAALAADLEYVAAAENRRLFSEEIERRKREIAREVCSRFWPLLNLPPEERRAVLASFGLGEESGTPVRLPTNAVARYRVLVRSRKTEDDDWEPDREALECLTEDTTRGRDDALRELLAAELVAPGRRVTILYGSAGRRR